MRQVPGFLLGCDSYTCPSLSPNPKPQGASWTLPSTFLPMSPSSPSPFSRPPPKFQHPSRVPVQPTHSIITPFDCVSPLLPHCLTPRHPRSKCPLSPTWVDLLHGAHTPPLSSPATPLFAPMFSCFGAFAYAVPPLGTPFPPFHIIKVHLLSPRKRGRLSGEERKVPLGMEGAPAAGRGSRALPSPDRCGLLHLPPHLRGHTWAIATPGLPRLRASSPGNQPPSRSLPELCLEQIATAAVFPFTPSVPQHQFNAWTQAPPIPPFSPSTC